MIECDHMGVKQADLGGKKSSSFLLRLPIDLRQSLEVEAAEQGVSLNLLILSKLSKSKKSQKKASERK